MAFMADASGCRECRDIALELAQACTPVEGGAAVDEQAMERRHTAWRLWLTREYKTRPIVAPEILDMNKWYERPRKAHRFARAYRKKIKHERKTGHKITFPAAK
jgi:hypothetical protein